MKIIQGRNILLTLLAAIMAVGCHSFPYLVGLKQVPVEQAAPPVSELKVPDRLEASQLETGRDIYVQQCAQCHRPMPIREFAMDEWRDKIIPSMKVKAKLTSDQTESLTHYVRAVVTGRFRTGQ